MWSPEKVPRSRPSPSSSMEASSPVTRYLPRPAAESQPQEAATGARSPSLWPVAPGRVLSWMCSGGSLPAQA